MDPENVNQNLPSSFDYPCLVCCQSVVSMTCNDEFEIKQEIESDNEEGDIHMRNGNDFLTSILTLFQLKGIRGMPIEKESFCEPCKLKLKMVVQLQYQLKELEKVLELKKTQIKEQMLRSEKQFQTAHIYERHEAYYNFRRKVLGYRKVKPVKCSETETSSRDLDRKSERRTSPRKLRRYPDSNSISSVLIKIEVPDEENDNGEAENLDDKVDEGDDQEPTGKDFQRNSSDGSGMFSDMDTVEPVRVDSSVESSHNRRKPTVQPNEEKKPKRKSNNESRNEIPFKTVHSRSRRRKAVGPFYSHPRILVDPETGYSVYLQAKFEKLAQDKFRCVECNEVVTSLLRIKTHIIREHSDRHECKICGVRHARSYELKRHIETVHEGKVWKRPARTVTVVECPVCGKPFGNKSRLAAHIFSHYGEVDKQEATARGVVIREYRDKPLLQCDVCGAVTRNPHWLKNHELKEHPSTEEERLQTKTVCPDCGKAVSHAYLKVHRERFHSNLDDFTLKPFVCTFCDKRFHQQQKLDEHKRIHTGERPFKCTVCSKQFTTKGLLKYHNMQKHENKKPFKCSKCPKAFIKSSWLTRHFKTVHEGIKQKGMKKMKNQPN